MSSCGPGWARNPGGLGLATSTRNTSVTTAETMGGKTRFLFFLLFIIGFPATEPYTLRSIWFWVCLLGLKIQLVCVWDT